MTARRMVPNLHARKLPAKKSRVLACVCEVKRNMAASGNLKMPRPSIVFEESVIHRRKNWEIHVSETVQKMLKWKETARKGAEKDT